MMKRLLPALLLIAGCGTVHLTCPSDHVVTATLNGPNMATVAEQLAAAVGPMLAAKKPTTLGAGTEPTPPAPSNDGTLDVKTLLLTGVQEYKCGNATPPGTSTTVIVQH